MCRLAAEFSSVWLQILLWLILYNNNNNITQYYKQIKSFCSFGYFYRITKSNYQIKRKKTFASSFMFWFFSRSKPAWIGSSVASSNSAEKSAAVPSVKSISVCLLFFFCFLFVWKNLYIICLYGADWSSVWTLRLQLRIWIRLRSSLLKL